MAVPKKIINAGEQTKALYGAGDRPPGDTHPHPPPHFSLAGKAYLKDQLQLHKRNLYQY